MTTVAAQTLPATYTAHVYQGDSWTLTFRFKRDTVPVDLSGVQVAAGVRSSIDETIALVATVLGDPANGTITLHPPTGGLAADRYSYDVELTDAGVVTTWVRGTLHVQQDVTP